MEFADLLEEFRRGAKARNGEQFISDLARRGLGTDPDLPVALLVAFGVLPDSLAPEITPRALSGIEYASRWSEKWALSWDVWTPESLGELLALRYTKTVLGMVGVTAANSTLSDEDEWAFQSYGWQPVKQTKSDYPSVFSGFHPILLRQIRLLDEVYGKVYRKRRMSILRFARTYSDRVAGAQRPVAPIVELESELATLRERAALLQVCGIITRDDYLAAEHDATASGSLRSILPMITHGEWILEDLRQQNGADEASDPLPSVFVSLQSERQIFYVTTPHRCGVSLLPACSYALAAGGFGAACPALLTCKARNVSIVWQVTGSTRRKARAEMESQIKKAL